MDGLKRLNDDELEQMNGGIIVEFGGTYWIVSDDASSMVAGTWPDLDMAKFDSEWYLVSPEVLSPEQFEERFGFKFHPQNYLS